MAMEIQVVEDLPIHLSWALNWLSLLLLIGLLQMAVIILILILQIHLPFRNLEMVMNPFKLRELLLLLLLPRILQMRIRLEVWVAFWFRWDERMTFQEFSQQLFKSFIIQNKTASLLTLFFSIVTIYKLNLSLSIQIFNLSIPLCSGSSTLLILQLGLESFPSSSSSRCLVSFDFFFSCTFWRSEDRKTKSIILFSLKNQSEALHRSLSWSYANTISEHN